MPFLPHISRHAAIAAFLLLLAGCGGTTTQTVPGNPPTSGYPGVSISGTALAGAKPISGSSIQLLAAGTSGNGSAPASLASTTSSTPSGTFSIAAGYTCPAAASQLFLTATGGTPAGSSTAAPALQFIVPLGRCDQLAPAKPFTINEVTTASTAWALSAFLASSGGIGATSTNSTGLANAVAAALSLASNTSGVSPGPTFPANGASPAPRINTLANLLNACAVQSTACNQLFSLTTPAGKPAPATTLDAALNLVRHPATNVSALFTLAATSTAFSPVLTSAPADWTLALTFTGAGMNEPGPLAVDGSGNIWVANYFGVLSEFSPIGAPTFTSGITGSGLSESYGLAIDPSNNIWVADESSPSTVNGSIGAVTVFNSAGQPLSGPNGFSAGGLNYPIAVAIDPNGTAWIVDYGNSHLTQLNPSGQPLSGASGYFSNLFAFPVAIAIDASHNAWIANMGGNSITRVSADGQQFTRIACCNTPSGLALDAAGNIWVANYLGDSVSLVSSTGSVISSGYTGGGLLHPQGIAIDGAGDVWVANFRGNSISELAGATSTAPGQPISPAAGWAPTPTSLQDFAIAIDPSGNLWISNFGNNSIREIVGLATPVKTPLSALPQLP